MKALDGKKASQATGSTSFVLLSRSLSRNHVLTTFLGRHDEAGLLAFEASRLTEVPEVWKFEPLGVQRGIGAT